MSTHEVELSARRVTKRFRSGARGAVEREWRALELLAEYAPGLAPAPLQPEPGTAESVVAMTRLPGDPLRGRALDDTLLNSLAEAVNTLHSALPPGILAGLPPRPGRQQELTAQLRSWAPRSRIRPRDPRDEVAAAMGLGLRWLERSGIEDAPPDVPEVFGAGDGNLANYLWDGSRVRVVDFEDSGRSDRAFELAEITEHVGSWVDRPLQVRSFLGKFALTPAESVRLEDCRRLLALVWLFLLSADGDQENPRNPAGTAERQAGRLTALLT
ncbi:MAG TPA: aminoglycoside phosphotransferase family protein [Streptomyces sp.]|jgi:Ser/Thr protein kinase RdoA (MazF antagonist)|nr:aminoglycoside phosphotransferase family protein [Streptomyces sp.]